MSTILATIDVKLASCFGNSSERAMRESRVPVYYRVSKDYGAGRGKTLKDGMGSWPILFGVNALDCCESFDPSSSSNPSGSPSCGTEMIQVD